MLARNPPQAGRPATVAAMTAVLRRAPIAWLLGAFYFLTFGGFVAFSIYLPTLLRAEFGLAPADAGLRAAGFVVLATLMRPIGGWLADRIGGAQVLSWVFGGVALFSLLLTWSSMVPFTVGALGCAMLMGLGNGAVFKLVPEQFPKDTGTVTGLVGAFGGLGGFFPPLLLGVFHDRLGVIWPGFLLLSATALVLRGVNQRVFRPGDVAWTQSLPVAARQALERVRAGAWAALVTATLAAAIVVGSRNLQHFDAALVGYTFATLFAAFGISYRYAMWLQRPPTRMYWRRGWQAFFSRRALARNAVSLPRRALVEFAANAYIFRRGRLRGLAHWLIMWGCVLAAAITFPLVWGWIHFETVPGDLHMYRTFVFGIATQDFPVESLIAFVVFHGLVWSSFLVIAGVMLAFRRRMIDHGAVAVQQFGQDILPLLLLFAISMTGLMLTASYTWMRGYAYEFLAILHAATVIVTLLWLPFGKLFHVFQRPAQLGVGFYKDAGARGQQAACRRCGQAYASLPMVRDLVAVEQELGFQYEMTGGGHYQDVCPRCRRALFGLAQGAVGAGRRLEKFRSIPVRMHHRWRCARSDPRHLSPMTGVRLSTSAEPDRLVKTHCCFCGQQCGIQLKVRENEVIGFEPWEEFPFNRGMLCPKGVKRYLQGSHPDRLMTALRRDTSSPSGFSALPYAEASIVSRPRSAASSRLTARARSRCSAAPA